jgi:pimeloyl-ACP methyl ester carboxylesterase
MVRGTACNEILWIHGWATSANVWQPSIQRITDYHHHVLDFSQCISESDFIQVLRNKLAELNRPVSVVGWSLGGMILLQHLLETSDPLIQRAIIVDATLCFVDRRARLGWPEFVLRRMQANIISGETNQTLVQFFAKMSLPSDVQLRPETDFSTSVLVAGLEYLIQTDLREQWQRQAVEAPEILARIH